MKVSQKEYYTNTKGGKIRITSSDASERIEVVLSTRNQARQENVTRLGFAWDADLPFH